MGMYHYRCMNMHTNRDITLHMCSACVVPPPPDFLLTWSLIFARYTSLLWRFPSLPRVSQGWGAWHEEESWPPLGSTVLCPRIQTWNWNKNPDSNSTIIYSCVSVQKIVRKDKKRLEEIRRNQQWIISHQGFIKKSLKTMGKHIMIMTSSCKWSPW